MKRMICLIDFEFRRVALMLSVISATMVMAQIISFLITLSKSQYKYYRFEHLLEIASYPFLFVVFLGAVLLLTTFSFYQNYYGSKSIYTLMALPGNRADIFVSKVFSAIFSMLFILAAQTASVFLAYNIYFSSLAGVPKMKNGLLLAFMRSPFLRTFLPCGIYSIFISIIFIISLAVMSVFLLISLKSGHYIQMTVIPAGMLWSIQAIYSGNSIISNIDNVFVPIFVIIFFTIYMILYSIDAISTAKIL